MVPFLHSKLLPIQKMLREDCTAAEVKYVDKLICRSAENRAGRILSCVFYPARRWILRRITERLRCVMSELLMDFRDELNNC